MTPNELINFWDEYLKRWHGDLQTIHAASLEAWRTFFEDEGNPFNMTSTLYYRFFPEPYFGDPLAEDLQAVFINLNPGYGYADQDFLSDNRSVVRLFEENGYSYQKTMRRLVEKAEEDPTGMMKPTLRWWNQNRVDWVRKTFGLNRPTALRNIVGLELTPWHTTSFNEIAGTLSTNELKKYVFTPAANLSKRINNPYLNNGSGSIVIGRGLQGVSALQDLVTFRDCDFAVPFAIHEKWNVRRAVLNDTTLLIDFSKKGGGFGMKLPSCPELKTFFANELKTLQTAVI